MPNPNDKIWTVYQMLNGLMVVSVNPVTGAIFSSHPMTRKDAWKTASAWRAKQFATHTN